MRTWIAKISLYGAIGLLTVIALDPPRVLAVQEPAGEKSEKATGAQHSKEGGAVKGEEEHAKGVPLDFKTDLAFWSLVTFIIFLMILGRYAWKPLIAALDEREGKIRGDISAAESARLKAEQLLAEHASRMAKVQDEIRELLAQGRRDAEHAKQDILTQAQKEAQAARDRAVADISRARDSARKDLFDVMAGEVARATEHVLGRSVNAQDQDRLIDEALAQFPRRN